MGVDFVFTGPYKSGNMVWCGSAFKWGEFSEVLRQYFGFCPNDWLKLESKRLSSILKKESLGVRVMAMHFPCDRVFTVEECHQVARDIKVVITNLALGNSAVRVCAEFIEAMENTTKELTTC